jgi:large subunit ribosomal protein L5
MYFFESYYNNILKYDLINKFQYTKLKKIPKIHKIILNIRFKKSTVKQLSATLLALELITNKKGKFVTAKKPNLFLKIRKGFPIGCKITLTKKLMYNFLAKLIIEIFPKFKTSLQINKKKTKYDYIISYHLKNNLLFVELEQNYNFFYNILTDLKITILSYKTSQNEFLYLINSFKQPLQLKKHNNFLQT